MNDLKLVSVRRYRYDPYGMREDVEGTYVTHTDYRALEEDRDMWFRDHGIVETELREAREELAALWVRVGQLPDARADSADINDDPLSSGYDAGWNGYRKAALAVLGEVS